MNYSTPNPWWPPSGDVPPEHLMTGAHDDARAMFLDYYAATYFNGWDYRLGRYVPTHYPDKEKGALLILTPRERGNRPHGVVDVEWIKAMSVMWVEDPEVEDENGDIDLWDDPGHFEGNIGEGTRTMKWVCALADKHGVVLTLKAGNTGMGGLRTMKPDVLIPYYQRFGFVVDRKGSTYMTRQPKGRHLRAVKL